MKVVVAGASGIVGYGAIKHFASLPDWEVVGLSRRTPNPVPGVEFISLDLLDRPRCDDVLGSLDDVTHVVYAALYEPSTAPDVHWTPASSTNADYLQTNLQMLLNTVEPVEHRSPLEHVSVVHGTKAYATHLNPTGSPRVPLRESDPRIPHDNFYFLQEDYLTERQESASWTWTTWRATMMFGEAPGNAMSAIHALAVYGAIMREQGEPLHYPGNPHYRVVREALDSELLGEACAWAAGSPLSHNQIYNVSNGDQFCWQDSWGAIADALGMEAGESRPISLAERLPAWQETWASLVAEHNLTSSPDLAEVVGGSFAYMDRMLGVGLPAASRLQVESIIKLRQHGFAGCMDTEEMFRKWIRRLEENRAVPAAPRHLSAATLS
jgi:nucleoside-diphosphate-sugar epimerase